MDEQIELEDLGDEPLRPLSASIPTSLDLSQQLKLQAAISPERRPETKNYVFEASQWRCFDEISVAGVQRAAFLVARSAADANVATLELSRDQALRRSARCEQLRLQSTEHEFDVMLRSPPREQSRFEADVAIV